jgi:hypothetical protein
MHKVFERAWMAVGGVTSASLFDAQTSEQSNLSTASRSGESLT